MKPDRDRTLALSDDVGMLLDYLDDCCLTTSEGDSELASVFDRLRRAERVAWYDARVKYERQNGFDHDRALREYSEAYQSFVYAMHCIADRHLAARSGWHERRKA